jgi:hypothetical protein
MAPMKNIELQTQPRDTGSQSTTSEAGQPSNPDEIIDSAELARRLQVSIGSVTNWRKAGKLGWLALPGRSVRFHWKSTRDALLRMQRGGQ